MEDGVGNKEDPPHISCGTAHSQQSTWQFSPSLKLVETRLSWDFLPSRFLPFLPSTLQDVPRHLSDTFKPWLKRRWHGKVHTTSRRLCWWSDDRPFLRSLTPISPRSSCFKKRERRKKMRVVGALSRRRELYEAWVPQTGALIILSLFHCCVAAKHAWRQARLPVCRCSSRDGVGREVGSGQARWRRTGKKK